MRVERIKIKNYKGIKDITIDLKGKNALIFGINGMGKSSILSACAIVITKALSMAAKDRQVEPQDFEENDIRNGSASANIELVIAFVGG